MKLLLLGWTGFLVLILTACDTNITQSSATSTALMAASATVTPKTLLQDTAVGPPSVGTQLPATATIKPATITNTPTTSTMISATIPATVKPYPTWTPIPTFTPAPEERTPAPPAKCPDIGTAVSLALEDLYTSNIDESMRAYLNAGGSAAGLEAALNMLTNEADPPDYVLANVQSIDVTGDEVPEVIADLSIPEVGSYATTAALVFTCKEGTYVTALFLLLSPQEGIYPAGGYQILSVEDMNQDGIREVVVTLKVFEDRRYYILSWDGNAFISLIEPRFDDILLQTVYFVKAYDGEGTIMDTDADGSLELLITNNNDPTRQEIWAWNGHAFVLQSE
jgi:hypothetical protein